MKRLLLTLIITMSASAAQVLVAEDNGSPGAAPAPRALLIEAAIIEVAPHGSRGLNLAPAFSTPFASDQPNSAGGGKGAGFGYTAKLDDGFESGLKALSQDRRVRILQRPRIQTADGVPATLFVGESQPCSRHAEAGPTGSHLVPGPAQIGVTLEIAPSINPDEQVVMDLRLRVVRLAGKVRMPDVGLVPTTTCVEARAKIAVRDRKTILLGGLVQAGRQEPAPALGFPKELPVPRAVPSQASARSGRSELMLLIRPTLLPRGK
jgi:type II secretory pathway component GspD/PulD (secretin)